MKTTISRLTSIAVLAALCGCGESKPDSDARNAAAPSDSSAPPTAAPAQAVAAAVDSAKATVSALPDQFLKMAQAESDKMLGSLGADLVDKVKALGKSAAENTTLKAQLDSSMQSLLGGQDSSALSSLYQSVQAASLTPQQMQLAKEVGNIASAYVVQRNFSSLDGAKGDVATIVNSLRKGEVTPALPALQNIYKNTTLTPKQKDLLTTVVDKYAPSLKGAADSVQQGLKSLQGIKVPGQ